MIEHFNGYCPEDPGEVLTQEALESYLQSLVSKGCTKDTISNYRRSLERFFRWLPQGKALQANSAEQYQRYLFEECKYMPRTVNMQMTPVNGVLAHLGLWGYQAMFQVPLDENDVQPELTRNEYLRLLSTAKALGKENLYLMVKVFATVGVAVQELSRVTVEAVRDGKVVTFPNRVRQEFRVPPCVQKELLEFAGEQGISTGPVFVSKSGKNVSRSRVTGMIQGLAQDACVAEEKCTPRCLRKLYQATQEHIQANAAVMIQMAYDRLLEQEQVTYGWMDMPSAEDF